MRLVDDPGAERPSAPVEVPRGTWTGRAVDGCAASGARVFGRGKIGWSASESSRPVQQEISHIRSRESGRERGALLTRRGRYFLVERSPVSVQLDLVLPQCFFDVDEPTKGKRAQHVAVSRRLVVGLVPVGDVRLICRVGDVSTRIEDTSDSRGLTVVSRARSSVLDFAVLFLFRLLRLFVHIRIDRHVRRVEFSEWGTFGTEGRRRRTQVLRS